MTTARPTPPTAPQAAPPSTPPTVPMTDDENEESAPSLPHVNHVLVGLVLALIVSGLLSSGRLVDMAARQPFGPERDRWLTAARQVDDAAAFVGADTPGDALADLLDRDRPGSVGSEPTSDDIVIGALADEMGDDAEVAATTTTTVPAQPTTTQLNAEASAEAATTTTAAPTTTAPPETTTTTERLLRPISAEEPLLVWIGGDSLGEYVASNLLGGTADLDVSDFQLDFHISTGLTRPDFFDWPAQLSTAMIAQPHPEAVIYMVGGNDNQAMITEAGRVGFETEEWAAEYRARVGVMMDITGYPDSHMIWVGLPVMQASLWQPLPPIVNEILAEEAAARPWVTFIDIDALYRNEDGEYDQYIVGPDGESIRARAPDGVHITRRGSAWIADLVWAEIERIWPAS